MTDMPADLRARLAALYDDPAFLAEVFDFRLRAHAGGFYPVPVLNAHHEAARGKRTFSPGKQPHGTGWLAAAMSDTPPWCPYGEPIDLKPAMNSGIVCNGLVAIDMDCDDPALAAELRRITEWHLGFGWVRRREGSDRWLMLFRADEGEPLKMQIRGHTTQAPWGNVSLGVEALGKGQQFVAHGWHPSGGKLYWEGLSPATAPRSSLTAVTQEQVLEFFAAVRPLLDVVAMDSAGGPKPPKGTPLPRAERIAAASSLEFDGLTGVAGHKVQIDELIARAVRAPGAWDDNVTRLAAKCWSWGWTLPHTLRECAERLTLPGWTLAQTEVQLAEKYASAAAKFPRDPQGTALPTGADPGPVVAPAAPPEPGSPAADFLASLGDGAAWGKPSGDDAGTPPPTAGAGRTAADMAKLTANASLYKDGSVRSCIQSTMAFLRWAPEFRGRARLETMAGVVLLDGVPWSNAAITAMVEELSAAYGYVCQPASLKMCLELAAKENAFNALQDYLTGLKWDGECRIDGLMPVYFGTPNTEYEQLVGRFFLIAMAARAMLPGCQSDHMPILEGQQGGRKSSALRLLGVNWFTDALPPMHSDRVGQVLAGSWLVEVAELSALHRTASAEEAKAFLTRRRERYRRPYALDVVDEPRTVTFCGSTNEDASYLADQSGGRRFWPVKCGHIDLEALARDRDQLHAEAVACYLTGEAWWPRPEDEARLFRREQEDRREVDPWADIVRTFMDLHDSRMKMATGMTVPEILADVIRMPPDKQDPRAGNRLGRILRNLGWERQVDRPRGDGERHQTTRWFYPAGRTGA